ncbi:MAG: fibronectin type III domain-containing protein [Clostridiales Family XIII bacterium]|nr:fibronectin type III domain-containing protein [Clostridiales Family XIII bacterium]
MKFMTKEKIGSANAKCAKARRGKSLPYRFLATFLTLALILAMTAVPSWAAPGDGAELNGLSIGGKTATLGTPSASADGSGVVAGSVTYYSLDGTQDARIVPQFAGDNAGASAYWYVGGSYDYALQGPLPVGVSAADTVDSLAWQPASKPIPAIYNKTAIWVKVESQSGAQTNVYKIVADVALSQAAYGTLKNHAVADVDAKSQSDNVFDKNDVSFQVYTIRDLLGNNKVPPVINPTGADARTGARDASARMEYVRGVLQKLYDAGYRRIEPYNDIAGNYNNVTQLGTAGSDQVAPWLTAKEWHTILSSIGAGDMQITGWHLNVPGGTGAADANAQAKDAQLANFIDEIGLNHAIIAYAGFMTQAQVDAFLDNAGDFVDAFAARKIKVDYHIHNHELQQATKADGTLDNDDANVALTTILNRFDKDTGFGPDGTEGYKTGLELDINWASRSGRDILDIIDQFGDRLTYLHMKDVGYTAEGIVIYEEEGDGTFDIPSIIAKAMDKGTKFFAIEQDDNHLPLSTTEQKSDSMASSIKSIGYFKTLYGTKADVAAKGIQRATNRPAPSIAAGKLALDLNSIDSVLASRDGDMAGIKGVLENVRDIGYTRVQVGKLYGLTAATWAAMLRETGLTAIALQISDASATPSTLISRAEALGVTKVWYSNSSAFATYAESAAVLSELAALKQTLGDAGLTLGYRATSKDFTQKSNEDGFYTEFTYPGWGTFRIDSNTYQQRIVLDDVIDAGLPVSLDTFWTGRASRSVRDVIDRYASAISQVNLQDLGIGWNIAFVNEELYDGHLNMDAIIQAGNAANVDNFVVTQEGGYLGGDAIRSIGRSYNNLVSGGIIAGAASAPVTGIGTGTTNPNGVGIVAGSVSVPLAQAKNFMLDAAAFTGGSAGAEVSWYVGGSYSRSLARALPSGISAATPATALQWKPASEPIPAVYNKTAIWVKVTKTGASTKYYKVVADIQIDPAAAEALRAAAIAPIDTKDQSDGVFDAQDVSFQVYTVRDLLGNNYIPAVVNPSGAAALDGTRNAAARMEYVRGLLQTLYDAGYRRIEPYNDIAGNYNNVTQLGEAGTRQVVPWLTAAEWHQILATVGNGDMQITGWHLNVPGGTGAADANAQAKDAQLANFIDEIGLNHALIAYAGFTTQAQVDNFFRNAGDFVDAFSDRDIKVDYHIHNHELQQATKADGTLDNDDANVVLNTILNRFDNDVYKTGLELDINWASRSGRDVLDIMDQFSRPKNAVDRLAYLHIKDVGFTSANTGATQGTIIMEEQGAGTLDLPSIIAKGMDYNVKYFAVEQDSNFVPFGWPNASAQNPNGGNTGDSMLSSITSMNYLKTLFGTTAQVRAKGIQRANLPAPKIKDTELSLDLAGWDSYLAGYAGSERSIRGILKDIKAIGYKNIQVSQNLYGLTIEQWAALIKEAGLNVSAYQISAVPTSADIDGISEAAGLLGTKRVVYSNKNAFGTASAQTYANSAAVTSQLARVQRSLKGDGISFVYRVTNKDFAQKLNSDGYGTANANATYSKLSAIDDVYGYGVPLDIDTFWTGRSSRTVRDEVDKYAGGIEQISLQDLGITWNISYVSEELYEGHLNLDSIISAANAAGVKSYVVTQEGGWYQNDPLASARRSYDSLKAKGVLQTETAAQPDTPPTDIPSTDTPPAVTPQPPQTAAPQPPTSAQDTAAAAKVGKPSGIKLKAGKGLFKLSWKKADVTGYQIQYTTDKKFKKGVKAKTIAKGAAVSYTVKKLKKGKVYYVKIRAYKTVDGTKIYSPFSKVYKVKIK